MLMRPFPRDVHSVGFMCALDLFPVPESLMDADHNSSAQIPPSQEIGPGVGGTRPTFYPLHPYTTGLDPILSSPFQIPRQQPVLRHLSPSEVLPDVVLRMKDHLITESSNMTPALVGDRVVEPALVDYQGKKSLFFVFGVSDSS